MSLYDNIVCCTQMYTHKSLPCCLTMNSLCLHLFIIQYTIGDEDRKTWEGVDYTSLVDGIWRTISIHAHHQQRCENFVQMSALIARTMVGEARRTWRAIAISATIKSSGKEEHVNAEFMARNILEMKEFIEEYGELDDSGLKDVPFLDRKKFIKTHEVLIEVQRNTLASFEDVWKETNAITPQSDMVRAMLERNSEEEETTTTEPNMGL